MVVNTYIEVVNTYIEIVFGILKLECTFFLIYLPYILWQLPSFLKHTKSSPRANNNHSFRCHIFPPNTLFISMPKMVLSIEILSDGYIEKIIPQDDGAFSTLQWHLFSLKQQCSFKSLFSSHVSYQTRYFQKIDYIFCG